MQQNTCLIKAICLQLTPPPPLGGVIVNPTLPYLKKAKNLKMPKFMPIFTGQ